MSRDRVAVVAGPLFCLHSGLRVSGRFSGVRPRGLHNQQIAKEFSLW